jgi:exopolysaccharide production protein ExoZ
MARKIVTIQYLRAASAVAIVAFHAGAHFHANFHVGEARVVVFFVMSGFVLWLVTTGRANDPGQFLARRLARLVPLYWLVTLLMMGKDLAGFSEHVPATAGQLLGSLLFVPHLNAESQVLPVLVPGWTLVYEVFFCVLFTLLLTVKEPQRIWAASIVFGGLAAAGLVLHPAGPIGSTYANPILLEFLAGLWLAHLWPRLQLSFLAALVLAAAGLVLSLATLPFESGWPALVTVGLPALMIVTGVLGMDRPGAAPIGSLKAIGDAAYSIYLWHLPVLGVAWWGLRKVGVRDVTACVITGTIAATVVGWLAYHVLEKPLTAWLFARLDDRAAARRRKFIAGVAVQVPGL